MRVLLLILCLMVPMQALAGDISATYEYSDGTLMTISSQDIEHVRMDSTPDAYTLMTGNKVYMISSDGNGGWNVMDMDQMAGMMGMVGEDTSGYSASYVSLGRSERIAGYTGKVYEVTVTDNGKLVSRDEIVLANHGDLEKLNAAWMAMAKRMTQGMGMNMHQLIEEAERMGYGGMLRYGTDMTLKSLSKSSLPAGYFELPSGGQAVQMPMGAASSAQPAQEDSMLEEDVKDIGDAAHDEAKQSTIEEVQEGVSNVFDSIFD